jgi:DNA-binding CsgD family transcriptional regulator
LANLAKGAVRGEVRPEGRLFFETAFKQSSAAALADSFKAAAAVEGVSRHFCTRHKPDGVLELLSCDYPFDPEGVAELGRVEFMIDDQAGSRVSVTMAGLAPRIAASKRARLHGLAMLYATCLPPLLDAQQPMEGYSLLSDAERDTLSRLLMGESELDISLSTGVPIRSVSRRISDASAKLGAATRRSAIVVAVQRGLLIPHH